MKIKDLLIYTSFPVILITFSVMEIGSVMPPTTEGQTYDWSLPAAMLFVLVPTWILGFCAGRDK
jgi:hypothetical protein